MSQKTKKINKRKAEDENEADRGAKKVWNYVPRI